MSKKSLNDDEFLLLGEKKKYEDFKIKNIDTFYRKIDFKYLPQKVDEYSKKMNLFPLQFLIEKTKEHGALVIIKMG
jgi:hypothetical protein